MNKEANSKDNRHVKSLVDNLYYLRGLEHSGKDTYKQAKPVIDSVIKSLRSGNNFLLYKPFWEEIHDRMVFYYDYLNEENLNKKIPLFRMTLHNEAIVWWLKCKEMDKLCGPLIHFDTHDDMGLPDSSKGLLKTNGCIDNFGINKGSCGQIYWPVTCLLLAKGVDQVIWAYPKWVYDDDRSFDQFLVCSKKGDDIFYMRSKNEKKDDYIMKSVVHLFKGEQPDEEKLKFMHSHRFDRLHAHTASKWKKMNNLIQGNKFILDIDLDFFVSNGDKFTKTEYKKDFNDIESNNRVHDLSGIRTPRMMYQDNESIDVVNLLNKEFKLIQKRLDVFVDGLTMLKKEGKTPCCINISDSTTSFFSGNTDRAVFTNQYTPKYFVPVIHSILISEFGKLYGKNSMK
jgi:hypothetical protein